MKHNLLILWAMFTGVIFLSGCYTKFTEPIVRQEVYEQTESDTTVIQEDQSYENYAFDSSNLSEYNLGYRDAYRDFLNSNLWFGYNSNSWLYFQYRYRYSPYNSYYLGYYDPWFYDPFYDWGYNRYYSYYGGYYDPYYGYYAGGYYGHGGHWNHSGGGGETISAGPDQKKAKWQAKETTVSGSRASDTGTSSDFQSTISNLPFSSGTSSTTSTTGTTTVTTITGSGSQKARWTSKDATTGTTSNDESIVGFQTKLVPTVATQTTVIRQNTGSPTSSKATYTKKSGSTRASTSKQSPSSSNSSSSGSSSSTPSSSSGSSGSSNNSPSSSGSSGSSSSGSSSSSSSSGNRSTSGSSSSSSPSSSPKASSGSSKDHKK